MDSRVSGTEAQHLLSACLLFILCSLISAVFIQYFRFTLLQCEPARTLYSAANSSHNRIRDGRQRGRSVRAVHSPPCYAFQVSSRRRSGARRAMLLATGDIALLSTFFTIARRHYSTAAFIHHAYPFQQEIIVVNFALNLLHSLRRLATATSHHRTRTIALQSAPQIHDLRASFQTLS